MPKLFGFEDWHQAEWNARFFCKACDQTTEYVQYLVRPIFYVGFVGLSSRADRRFIRCLSCKRDYPLEVLNTCPPWGPDDDAGYESLEPGERVFACWFDGLWSVAKLDRKDGDGCIVVFDDIWPAWLPRNYVCPCDLEIGDRVLVGWIDENEPHLLGGHLLSLPSDACCEVRLDNGVIETLSTSQVQILRSVLNPWRVGDRVRAYHGSRTFIPATVDAVVNQYLVDVTYVDGCTVQVPFRLLVPDRLTPGDQVRMLKGEADNLARVVAATDRSVATIRLDDGTEQTVNVDALGLILESLFRPATVTDEFRDRDPNFWRSASERVQAQVRRSIVPKADVQDTSVRILN